MIALWLALAASAADVSTVVTEHNDQRYRIERRTNQVLIGWGATSVVAGTVGVFALEDEARAFSEMSIGWGAINTLIGVVGAVNLRGDRGRRYTLGDTLKRDAALERVFWINAGADVAYIGAGSILFMQGRRIEDPRMVGWGAAIVTQGWFLLVFDLVNAMTHARRQRSLLIHPAIQDHLGVGVTANL